MPLITRTAWRTIFLFGVIAGSAHADLSQQVTPQNLNCGINSTLALAHIQGQKVASEVINQLSKKHPESTVSLAGVKEIATSLNINTEGVKATLDEVSTTRALIRGSSVVTTIGSKECVRIAIKREAEPCGSSVKNTS